MITFVTFSGIMNIRENLESLGRSIPPEIKLIAVSKTQSPETIMKAYSAGQRAFGENKVQELITKASTLPSDIQWHFIGHLQTNKVRLIVPFIDMIHSVDSLKLLKEVDKEAGKIERVISCLLQFHIATEETKFGLDLTEAIQLLDSTEFKAMKHIRIRGLMGMATFTDDQDLIRQEFKHLRDSFTKIKARFFRPDGEFSELSMGMSGDYELAMQEGSTMVRIGSSVFGDRPEH
ncbi:MAG: YggS family pyridoxal phosphate-dependent enzyme [Bacteroidetes bacterium]|nr:YggS family pyridoxal phosphate-dependent enzyme [Bacteroidota bacterium]